MFVIVEASLHLGPPSCAQRDAGLGPGRADLLILSPLREAPAGLPDQLDSDTLVQLGSGGIEFPTAAADLDR